MSSRSSTHAETLPFWSDTAGLPTFGKLDRNHDVDVVIVGAGITGLTAAYLLSGAGRSAAVIDRDRCAQIDTGHTSAHVTMVTDDRLSDLVSRFGRTHAQAVWDAGLAAIMQIHAIVHEHDIACEFAWVDGYLHEPGRVGGAGGVGGVGGVRGVGGGRGGDGEAKEFEQEAATANELGFDAEFVSNVPLFGGPGVRFDNQARFHPRKYLAGVARVLRDRGVGIYEHTNADEFQDSPLAVKANGHTLRCRDIVVATHNPVVGVAGVASATLFQTKLALYSSYVVAGRAPSGVVPDALFWDTADPYRFLRVERHRDHDVIIYGGEDHKTGQVTDPSECYQRLGDTLRALVPEIELTHRWSGQVIETPDGLPFIGRMTDHQYAATGFSGNGMTFGTLAAMMMSDAILAQPNPWTELFDPGRKALGRGLWEYIKENKDYPYYLVRDRFAGADGKSLRSVKRGEGKIIEKDGTKLAAFRDDDGALSVRSATCTHMACIVAWNPAEKTWDCPCHGSRFEPNGKVISGPAESPLAEG